jgi:hypothetical protein
MIKALIVHTVFSTVGLFMWVVFGSERQSFSFFIGAALSGAHLLIMIWCWQQIFNKKSVALAGSVIVIKYAVLGVIVFKVLTQRWLDALPFVAGLGAVVASIIVSGFIEVRAHSVKFKDVY